MKKDSKITRYYPGYNPDKGTSSNNHRYDKVRASIFLSVSGAALILFGWGLIVLLTP